LQIDTVGDGQALMDNHRTMRGADADYKLCKRCGTIVQDVFANKCSCGCKKLKERPGLTLEQKQICTILDKLYDGEKTSGAELSTTEHEIEHSRMIPMEEEVMVLDGAGPLPWNSSETIRREHSVQTGNLLSRSITTRTCKNLVETSRSITMRGSHGLSQGETVILTKQQSCITKTTKDMNIITLRTFGQTDMKKNLNRLRQFLINNKMDKDDIAQMYEMVEKQLIVRFKQSDMMTTVEVTHQEGLGFGLSIKTHHQM